MFVCEDHEKFSKHLKYMDMKLNPVIENIVARGEQGLPRDFHPGEPVTRELISYLYECLLSDSPERVKTAGLILWFHHPGPVVFKGKDGK